MKKILLILALSLSSSIVLASVNSQSHIAEKYDSIIEEFDNGKSIDAVNFFRGVVEHVVRIEVLFRKIEILDSIQTTPIGPFKKCIEDISSESKDFKKILAKYEKPIFEYQNAFVSLTHKWVNEIMYMIDTHISKLIAFYIIKDEDWTDDQIALYDFYAEDYKVYAAIDDLWVEAQYTFAEKNDFELAEEEINVNDRIENEKE